MPGTIQLNIQPYLKESGTKPFDLVRSGISPTTAYNLYHGKGQGISFDVLAIICDFFSQKLGRVIGPGDLLVYHQGGDTNHTTNYQV